MIMDDEESTVRLLQSSGRYYRVLLFSIICGMVLYGCWSWCQAWARQNQAEQEAAAEVRRRAAARAAAQTAAAAAQAAQPRQQQRLTNDQLVDGMSKTDREAFVKNFLKTEVMTMERAKMMITGEIAGADIESGSAGISGGGGEAPTSMLSMISVTPTSPQQRPGAATEEGGGSMISVSRQQPQDGGSMISSRSILSGLRTGASGFFSHASGGGDNNTSSERYPQCAICLERLKVNEEIGLSQNNACPHVFHKACISEWLLSHKECPICRRRYLDLDAV